MTYKGSHAILLFLICLSAGYSQLPGQSIFLNHIYSDNIRTVQLYREGWNLSYPVMKLHSTDKLVLHFDLLDDHAETYYYSFIHCDKDWKRSDIYEKIGRAHV